MMGWRLRVEHARPLEAKLKCIRIRSFKSLRDIKFEVKDLTLSKRRLWEAPTPQSINKCLNHSLNWGGLDF